MSSDIRRLADGGAEPQRRGFAKWIGGRARRREYWLWLAPLLIVQIGLAASGFQVAYILLGLPILFIWIRRYHDLGRSGWFAPITNVFLNVAAFGTKLFLPPTAAAFAGLLIYLGVVVALGSVPGQQRDNEFGAPRGLKPGNEAPAAN